MSKAIVLILAMIAIHSINTKDIELGKQLIQNGNFAKNDCKQGWCIFRAPKGAKHWTAKPEIQIGYGSIYHSGLGKERIVELAPNYNSCIEQKIKNLMPGLYELKYEWAAREGTSFEDCHFIVKFNDKEIKKTIPNDYELRTDSLEIKITEKSEGKVEFCGAGVNNISYGAILRTVSLKQKEILQVNQHQNVNLKPSHPLLSELKSASQIKESLANKIKGNLEDAQFQPLIKKIIPNLRKDQIEVEDISESSENDKVHSKVIKKTTLKILRSKDFSSADNLIVNGGFENNECSESWCIFDRKDGTDKVKGWEQKPEIEVGSGNVYHYKLTENRVVELDANANTCIRQKVSLKPGKYILRFDWVSRQGVSSESTQFEVKLNDQKLKQFLPADENLHQEQMQIDLSDCPEESWIEFCGTGISDGYGAILDNIQLFRSKQ